MPRFPDPLPTVVPVAPLSPPAEDPEFLEYLAATGQTKEAFLRSYRDSQARIARTDAALALHRLSLDHQADDAAAQADMAENGDGWHDGSMTRFDARAAPFLAALSPELNTEFAPLLANVRGRRGAAAAQEQYRRRTAWAMNAAQTLKQAGLSRTGADPDNWASEHALYIGHVAALPLLDNERASLFDDGNKAFRGAASHAYVDAGRDDDALAVLADDNGQIHPQLESSMRGLMLTRDAVARQKAADARLKVTGQIYDDLDAMRQTGSGSPDLSPREVKAALGDQGLGD